MESTIVKNGSSEACCDAINAVLLVKEERRKLFVELFSILENHEDSQRPFLLADWLERVKIHKDNFLKFY